MANSNFHRENSKGNYTLKPISTHCEAMAVYYEQRSNVMIISWRDFTWLFLDLRNTRFLMTLAGDVINKKIRKYLTDFTYSFTTALSLPLAGAVLNSDLTWPNVMISCRISVSKWHDLLHLLFYDSFIPAPCRRCVELWLDNLINMNGK